MKVMPCCDCGSFPQVFILEGEVTIRCPECELYWVTGKNVAKQIKVWNEMMETLQDTWKPVPAFVPNPRPVNWIEFREVF